MKKLQPDVRRNLELVRRIKALCALLGTVVREPDKDGYASVGGSYDSRSERDVDFNPLTGLARVATWQTSGHNGDPYDYRTQVLSVEASHSELLGVVSGLEHRALEAERRRLEQAAEKRRTAEAMKNLNARLKSFGG